LDKSTGECVAACDSGFELDTESGTCVYMSASVDDAIRVQVCEGHSNMMPVLEEGASSITCGCRAAWYGDDCDQLYQVYIPDELFREKVCNYAGYGAIPCDVSEFEMAGHDYSLNIYDFNSLFTLNRLQYLYIYGNEQIYDISVSFRNVGMYMLHISNTSKSAFIPLCRSEDDTPYWDFIAAVFPIHYSSQSSKDGYFLPNSCPINLDNYYYCSGSNCPSIVLNEVYNSVADTPVKECAFIAKTSGSVDDGDLICYTIHDDNIRAYLSDPTNGCLISSDIESNGMISVATLRSSLSCPSSSLSLSSIVTDMGISSVNSITTLQGLEYATSLTSLNIDGYDLSGDINDNAEYDKLVVQILAKAVIASNDYGSIDSGLTSLSASGCGLSAVGDILDLTPIVDNALGLDTYTQPFKLTSLDLSNNNISDVSVLITSSMFPDSIDGVLTTLDISGNNICDIEGMVSALQSNFSTLSSITYSDQTCHCSASVSSSSYQVCREVYPDQWAVECWNGYYLDKSTGECVSACDSGSELNTESGTCVSVSASVDDAIRVQVCEGHSNMMPVLEEGASSITCGCRAAWYGDDCDQLYQVYIPDELFRQEICSIHGYGFILCDISEFELADVSFFEDNSIFVSDRGISNIGGVEYIYNVNLISINNSTSIYSIAPVAEHPELYEFYMYSDQNNMIMPNLSSIGYSLTRLNSIVLYGFTTLSDISLLYANFGLEILTLSNSTVSSSIPLCRTEDDQEFDSYLSSIFPLLNDVDTNNVCTLNAEELNCSSSDLCPSIVNNEIYNVDLGIIECNAISKQQYVQNVLVCSTIHDEYLRNTIISGWIDIATQSTAPISVASLRDIECDNGCSLSVDVSDSNPISSLRGIEFISALTTLSIYNYNISTDGDEYDKFVIKTLAKAIDYEYTLDDAIYSVHSGLTTLNLESCGIESIEDVLELSSISEIDQSTRPFKLSTLNLSDNNISDVSVLITSSMFPEDVLTTLDISGNSICDIDNVVTMLQSHFTNIDFKINATSQSTCPCSEGADVSFSSHKTCRKRSNGYYQVECWNGYFLDKETNSCVEAVSSADSIRCQVCERKDIFVPILDLNSSDISCGCSFGFHGDSCEYVDIPDSNLRSAVCLAVVNPSAHDSSCDDLTLSDMATVTSVSASIVDSFEGLQSAVNLTSLSISGTSSSSVSIGNTDLGYLPLSLVELSLEAVYLDADSDFSIFPNLTTLSLKNNSSYDLTNSALFPSSSSSSSSSFTSLDVSYTALSSFSSIPTSITTLTANNCSSLTSFSTISNLTNLVSLDVSNASNIPTSSSLSAFASLSLLTSLDLSSTGISDPSPLYALSSNSSWISLDLSNNYICDGDDGDSAIETFLASKFSPATVSASGQDCICSSDDLGSTPLDANKVCSETKPGSNTWYVVCASDSFTSYTSAEDFSCTSPDNGDGRFGCSGGCEYGYECRYDSTSTSTSCQQVIVDENLHDCVADMFGTDSNGNPDYTHRTATSPSLFSVASLKTLVSVDDGYGVYSPVLSCPSMGITDLTGIEHITEITSFDLSLNNLNTAVSPACLDSLMHLSHLLSLNLDSNSNITLLPDL
ncbi:Acidic leucine-rich nuclear phosphoprotein 32 like protein, partial [Aduncisulcus paluster]